MEQNNGNQLQNIRYNARKLHPIFSSHHDLATRLRHSQPRYTPKRPKCVQPLNFHGLWAHHWCFESAYDVDH